ncbi:peptidoglycan-binding domain-containing protein [Roseicyclus amphidinii]|uniref:peptidoglycan-binding domain-containing protein n=1 Tax=Roseicyclus amphidinii TaxID=3034232 RepID=UPI0024E0D6A5|nr:peptidoglycan-binding domain-containing protein [Roseicyclus sp. Amp-Y-6]
MLKSTLFALAMAVGAVGLAAPSQAQGTAPLGVHEVAALAQHADLRDRDLVRVLQRSLRSHGLYGGAIDGIAGPHTMHGLRLAQQLSSPWIVPVVRHDLRTLPHVVLHGVPAYVTEPMTRGQIAVVPVPFHAPTAPWRVQHMYYDYRN